LAHCGIASRRKAEEYIRNGMVKVNGEVVTKMGAIVSEADKVEFNGKPVSIEKNKVYIMLNKPREYVTTMHDPQGRKTVMDLIRNLNERVYPVGRLDYDTSGLLLLTNDGELAYRMTHPSYEIIKVYIAVVRGYPSQETIRRLESGIEIDSYVTAPAHVNVIKQYENKTKLEITIHEGRNRQVRRMCEAAGHPVIMLKRIKLGCLALNGLKSGQWRFLTKHEIKKLKGMM
jgi:23S rRNA pseudouridine2605 synthase